MFAPVHPSTTSGSMEEQMFSSQWRFKMKRDEKKVVSKLQSCLASFLSLLLSVSIPVI
jgi:hypothetical protein